MTEERKLQNDEQQARRQEIYDNNDIMRAAIEARLNDGVSDSIAIGKLAIELFSGIEERHGLSDLTTDVNSDSPELPRWAGVFERIMEQELTPAIVSELEVTQPDDNIRNAAVKAVLGHLSDVHDRLLLDHLDGTEKVMRWSDAVASLWVDHPECETMGELSKNTSKEEQQTHIAKAYKCKALADSGINPSWTPPITGNA